MKNNPTEYLDLLTSTKYLVIFVHIYFQIIFKFYQYMTVYEYLCSKVSWIFRFTSFE